MQEEGTQGMATLPINPNEEPEQPQVAPVVTGLLNVADYNPGKSYVVFGKETKTHKEYLKQLGGRFNGKLKEKPGFPGGPAWIFFQQDTKPQVMEFVRQVNGGTITTQAGIPAQGEGMLPTVAAPVRNNKFQYVKYKVFKPADGMSVTIKTGGNKMQGEVLQTENHRNVVDTVYISVGGNTSKLVICNGRWQVWGYMSEHTIFFNEVPDATVQFPDTAEDPYADIANV